MIRIVIMITIIIIIIIIIMAILTILILIPILIRALRGAGARGADEPRRRGRGPQPALSGHTTPPELEINRKDR